MFDTFIQKLKNKEPFSFARYGDGEFSAMFNTRPETHGNVDGHLFYKDMGEALVKIVKSRPKYYLGMQRFAREETHPKEIEKFLTENNLQDYPWVNADIWHHASIKGYFEDFFKAIEERKVIFVAPEYLQREFRFNRFKYSLPISISEKNCWLQKDKIIDEVRGYLKIYNKDDKEGEVVLFCASMPTKVMIDELYQEFGQQHTFLDMGSVFDVYVGRASRSYHKKVIARLNNKA